MSNKNQTINFYKYLLADVIRQFIDFRGRTPLKLGMNWGEGDIRALSANNVQMGRIDFNREAYFGSDALYQKWMTKGKCERGDILLTTEAPLGNVAQVPDNRKYILSQRVILLKADTAKAESDYLLHLFQSETFQKELIRQSTGTTVIGIQQAKLARIKIELPSLITQKKTATVFQTIDRTIAKTEALIKKYQQIKAGLMHDLFTRGIGADGKLRPRREEAPELYRETAIGWIPKEWECLKLEKVSEKITDGDHHTPIRTNEGVYLLSARNILNGKIALFDVDYVPEFEYTRMIRRCNPETGDILISCSGTIGRVAIVPENLKCCLVRSAALIKLYKDKITGKYTEIILQSPILQSQIKASQKQAAQPNLFQGQIEALLVPVPTISEQIRLTMYLNPCEQKLKKLESEFSKLSKLKSGLMHDLLTGKVSVNVDSDAP